MKTIFVLLMVFEGQKAATSLQQEFNSYEGCEKARQYISKTVVGRGFSVSAQGCFEK